MHCALPPSPSTTSTASDHQPLPGDLYVRADNVKISSPFEHLPKNHCQRKIEPYHLASCNLKHDAFTSVPPQLPLPLPLTPGRQNRRSPQQMQLLQHQKTLNMKQKMQCRLFSMHWCTIYSEFGHPRISSYQNKIARRTDQLWEFSNELRSQHPNLWAQQVRRRQSDHYLKDVWSWKSSVERKKWQHLHWLSKPHIWGSWEALQIGSNWS